MYIIIIIHVHLINIGHSNNSIGNSLEEKIVISAWTTFPQGEQYFGPGDQNFQDQFFGDRPTLHRKPYRLSDRVIL